MQLVDKCKFVVSSAPGILTTTVGDGDYVSLKNYAHCTVVIMVDNATTVTGAAITLKQATVVAGSDEKALEFAKMYANLDVAAADTLAETAVASNTFTTLTTDNKNTLYVIEVPADSLDVENGFDCLRCDCTLMANAVGAVLYILSGARYQPPLAVSAITD